MDIHKLVREYKIIYMDMVRVHMECVCVCELWMMCVLCYIHCAAMSLLSMPSMASSSNSALRRSFSLSVGDGGG